MATCKCSPRLENYGIYNDVFHHASFYWSFVWKTLFDQRRKPHDCKIKTAVFALFSSRNLQIMGVAKVRNCKNHSFHRFWEELRSEMTKTAVISQKLCFWRKNLQKILAQNCGFCCIVYPIDSFQDHLIHFYQCVPNWLLWRPYDLIFCIVYPIDSFQDHMT